MLYSNQEFQHYFNGTDPFKKLQSIDGKVYRQVKGRKTFQFIHNHKSYFAKLHGGVGWGEILKNIFQLRLPILGAKNEWQAISRLHNLGVDTMKAVAYDNSGWNPATRKSFIVTEDLTPTVSLEDYCKNWLQDKPDFQIKRKLIEKVADIARTMHHSGVCHRDFYLCHFLLHRSEAEVDNKAKLSLIDLHRALIKRKLARRWVVKDIAGLYYSAMHIGLTQRDLLRFIKCYQQAELRYCLQERSSFWKSVRIRAFSMFDKLGVAS